MKIQIHTGDVHLTIRIPTYLAFNALTASIAGHELKKHDFPQLDGKTLTVFFRELRRLKKKVRHGSSSKSKLGKASESK